VELAPSAVHIGELLKGPVDQLKGDSSRESKETLRFKGDKEWFCERMSTRGPAEHLHQLVLELRFCLYISDRRSKKKKECWRLCGDCLQVSNRFC
jgi:hypothetical protein